MDQLMECSLFFFSYFYFAVFDRDNDYLEDSEEDATAQFVGSKELCVDGVVSGRGLGRGGLAHRRKQWK